MLLQLFGGALGAGEGDGVLAGQMIKEIADAAAQQLDRTFRQDSGFGDSAENELGQIAGARSRLDDRRHAGQQGGCELLEHSPAGKIERVDVHGRARARHVDVLPDEAAFLRQHFRLPVEIDTVVRHLAPAFAREHEQRRNAAVDVEPAVGARRARFGRQGVELLLVLQQLFRQRLQHEGALVKGVFGEVPPAGPARVPEHGCEVDAVRGTARQLAAVHRAGQGHRLAGSVYPAAFDVMLELHGVILGRRFAWGRTRALGGLHGRRVVSPGSWETRNATKFE